MKYKGSKMEYSEERVRDLKRVYDEYVASREYSCHMDEVYEAIVNMPAKRFWVNTRRAAEVISSMMKGDKQRFNRMRKNKKEMYREIYGRVLKVKKENPCLSLYEICDIVVSQSAPKFYLAPDSVKLMLCKAKKKWRKEMLKRLRL